MLTGRTNGIKNVTDVGLTNGKCIPLSVDAAYHSPLMQVSNDLFSKEVDTVEFRAPSLPVFCNGTGEVYRADDSDMNNTTSDVVKKHMTNPVKFVQMIQNAYEKEGARVFVEFGPKMVCSKFVSKILADKMDEIEVISVLETEIEVTLKR